MDINTIAEGSLRTGIGTGIDGTIGGATATTLGSSAGELTAGAVVQTQTSLLEASANMTIDGFKRNKEKDSALYVPLTENRLHSNQYVYARHEVA